jgi:HEAT repeat protein
MAAVAIGGMDDAALIAAIPSAGMLELEGLAAEAARRRLAGAIPALREVLARLTGFGAQGPPVREQAAALRALEAIGGPEATRAVADALLRDETQGATLALALSAAARLGAFLPPDAISWWLRHHHPGVRAAACGCARTGAEVIAVLMERLGDPDPAVRLAAALALARMGRGEALPVLMIALRTAPGAEVVDAVAAVADDDAVVALGRLARERPELKGRVLDALDDCVQPRARAVARGLRREA